MKHEVVSETHYVGGKRSVTAQGYTGPSKKTIGDLGTDMTNMVVIY